jgi:hypothetical protein
MVRRLKDNPNNVFPLDQIVIHDDKNEEYFIELFSGMRPEQLRDRIKKHGISCTAQHYSRNVTHLYD